MEHTYFYYGGEYYLQCTGVAMGAKLAPSLANLFMALWENYFSFSCGDSHLLFWHGYIDDAFFLWKGDVESLHSFMRYINYKLWGIRFTYKFSTSSVCFLDLVIFKEQDKLLTKTHFKSTDRNGFILLESCHNPYRFKAIPEGQCQWIRRNCSKIEDFSSQTDVFLKKTICLERL